LGEVVHELKDVREQITSIESTLNALPDHSEKKKVEEKKFSSDWDYLLHWVETLKDRNSGSKIENSFKFDTDAIVHAMNVAIINQKQ